MQRGWPKAEDIWRRWVLLAAVHAGLDVPAAVLRGDETLHLDLEDGTWARMRCVAGQRAVMWGHVDGQPPVTDADLLDLAPDWAVADGEVAAWLADGTSYVTWYRRGHWGRLGWPPTLPDSLTDDEHLIAAWAALLPGADADDLTTALAEPGRGTFTAVLGESADRSAQVVDRGFDGAHGPLSPSAAAHLTSVIHEQMRAGVELADRGHPARPSLLRQWTQVNAPSSSFRFAVHAADDLMHLSAANRGLSEEQQRSLTNVLVELRMAERDPRGAWLFAEVSGGSRSTRVERAYDHWPAWYVPGAATTHPRPKALAREMSRRSPDSIPAWGALLPRR